MSDEVNYKVLCDNYELPIYPKRDLVLVRGEGARLWDDHGREFIDCVAGQGSANIGHSNPFVADALCKQAKTLITCPGIFYNDQRSLLLERLVAVSPESLTRAFLCNSGAESVEAALKFARISTGRSEIVCAVKAFHGRTFGALSATFNPKYREGFGPLVPGFSHIPFNRADKLREAVSEKTAAVMIEVIQGEGGVNIGTAEFLAAAQEICAESGALLIVDEIQTGFGRTGKMFASEHFNLQPDLLCIAKSMAGGVPMGAVLCGSKVEVEMGKHGSTFGGNPLCCAAALATLTFIDENDLVDRAKERGAYLRSLLNQIGSDRIREIRNLGLMFGIELKEKSQPYVQALMDHGVLALPAGPTVLRLLPPLTISTEELDIVAAAVGKVLDLK